MSDILDDEFEVLMDVCNCKLITGDSSHRSINVISFDDTRRIN